MANSLLASSETSCIDSKWPNNPMSIADVNVNCSEGCTSRAKVLEIWSQCRSRIPSWRRAAIKGTKGLNSPTWHTNMVKKSKIWFIKLLAKRENHNSKKCGVLPGFYQNEQKRNPSQYQCQWKGNNHLFPNDLTIRCLSWHLTFIEFTLGFKKPFPPSCDLSIDIGWIQSVKWIIHPAVMTAAPCVTCIPQVEEWFKELH